MKKKTVLLLTNFFSPNIGGVETHLDDFVSVLAENDIMTYVLTYQPLTTKAKSSKTERHKNSIIRRFNWFGGNYFFLFKDNPILEFLYLFPPLFIFSFFFMVRKRKEIDIIHAHGIIVGATAVILGKLFKKKTLVSLHSIYHFPQKGFYKRFVRWIFRNSSHVLTLSQQSSKEIEKLGISKEKISVFTYWVNQEIFKPSNKERAKKKIKVNDAFTVLFIGRLITEKGIPLLLQTAKQIKRNVLFVIVGAGPLEEKIIAVAQKEKNILFFGAIKQENLPVYINAADLLIVPSTHEEGFGRVILESLSCGVPVVAAKRGGIKEAMDDSVGKLIIITPEEIRKTITYFSSHTQELMEKSKNALTFAKKYYSKRNAYAIIKLYE